ncbi:helix-turn-helix domain-containing protein [Roseivirga sp.]|uniref:helix-turn-helix domain-containing protein n=1 Tax=Roseivirga sp. TaxID=1964215 RepID=UPI003B8B1530
MNAVFYIGIFLSGFLSLLIFTKRENSSHDYILVSWLSISALMLFSFYYDFNYSSRSFEAIQLVAMVLPLAAAPLLYFYVCALVKNEKFRLKRYLAHFIPFAFIGGSMLYFYFNLTDDQMLKVDEGFIMMSGISAFQLKYYGMIMAFFSLIYPCLSLYLLFKHKQKIEGEFSNLNGVDMAWLRNWIILSLVGFWFSFAIIWSGSFQWIDFTTSFKSVAFMITINIGIIGFFGLKQTSIFISQPKVSDGSASLKVTEQKYQNSKLDQSTSSEILSKVTDHMTLAKPYLDTQLSLETLANQTGLGKHELSQVINEQLGINFFTFVNQYRVQEFKNMLNDQKFAHYTILGIALESGFNSKSTFNSIFKKLEGSTPGTYKKSLMESDNMS